MMAACGSPKLQTLVRSLSIWTTAPEPPRYVLYKGTVLNPNQCCDEGHPETYLTCEIRIPVVQVPVTEV